LKDSWTADRSECRNRRGIAASRVNGSRFDMGAPIPGWWVGPGTADDPAIAERGPGSITQVLRGRDRCPVTGTAGGAGWTGWCGSGQLAAVHPLGV